MIRNITKKRVLVYHHDTISSILGKSVGLMFKKEISNGILFNFNMENIHYIHTFFMRFKIDILFLDSEKKVMKVYKNVKPWKLNIHGKGKYVIELPSGKSFNTQIGDKISFK